MPQKEITSFDAWTERIFSVVQDIRKSFDSKSSDWEPTLFFLMENTRLGLVDLSDFFRTVESKGLVPLVVEHIFEQFEPAYAALITSAWMRVIQTKGPLASLEQEMLEEFGVSTHPKRKEILMVELSSKGGESATYYANILRHSDKIPDLGEWEKLDGKASGRLSSVLKRAFENLA